MASIDTVRLPSVWEGYGNTNSTTRSRWKCEYCAALNPDHLFRCDNCYAPREEECEQVQEDPNWPKAVQASVIAMGAFGAAYVATRTGKRKL